MKRIIFNITQFLLLALLLTACKENEIELYDQSPRINFVSNTFTEFTDVEYAANITEKEVAVRVRLQGDFLTEDRSFCLKSSKFESETLDVFFAEAAFKDKYIFPATKDSVEFDAIISVKRPEQFTSDTDGIYYRAVISFDNDNPLHQFDPGIEEWAESTLIVNYEITRPDEWSYSNMTWGPYSLGKYMFIMDTLHQTYDEFSAEDAVEENKQIVVEAYTTYLETNDPILDENGNDIYFPE